MGSSTTRRNPRSGRPGRVQSGGQPAHSHLKTLRRAGDVIARLDRELRSSLGRTELLRRAVQECGQANVAISHQMRQLSRHLNRRQRATPVVKTTLDNSARLERLAAKLTKTLDETRGLRDGLRATRNELGEARDDAARAHTETAELREELKRAGAARAEAVLRPLVAQVAAMGPAIERVTAAVTAYRAGVDWRSWQPQRAGTGLYRALEPVYHQLGIRDNNNTQASAAPAEIQAILIAVAGKFAEAMPVGLEDALTDLQRQMQTLTDSVQASLRAVERVPGLPAVGGGRRRRTRRRT